ncbi:hypothetical protein E2P81_ATG06118 [Venturia nashicola]|nr:hypothetical protein E2P81_ATG06118 [Venturia nashicola]
MSTLSHTRFPKPSSSSIFQTRWRYYVSLGLRLGIIFLQRCFLRNKRQDSDELPLRMDNMLAAEQDPAPSRLQQNCEALALDNSAGSDSVMTYESRTIAISFKYVWRKGLPNGSQKQ